MDGPAAATRFEEGPQPRHQQALPSTNAATGSFAFHARQRSSSRDQFTTAAWRRCQLRASPAPGGPFLGGDDLNADEVQALGLGMQVNLHPPNEAASTRLDTRLRSNTETMSPGVPFRLSPQPHRLTLTASPTPGLQPLRTSSPFSLPSIAPRGSPSASTPLTSPVNFSFHSHKSSAFRRSMDQLVRKCSEPVPAQGRNCSRGVLNLSVTLEPIANAPTPSPTSYVSAAASAPASRRHSLSRSDSRNKRTASNPWTPNLRERLEALPNELFSSAAREVLNSENSPQQQQEDWIARPSLTRRHASVDLNLLAHQLRDLLRASPERKLPELTSDATGDPTASPLPAAPAPPAPSPQSGDAEVGAMMAVTWGVSLSSARDQDQYSLIHLHCVAPTTAIAPQAVSVLCV